MDFGQQSQQQQSQSSGSSFNQSFVDPQQSPFLDFLRQASTGIAGQQLGSIGGAASDLSGQLGAQGQGFLDQLGGAGQGQLGGTDFLQQRLSEQNPFLNEQITQLGTDLGDQFQQQILPGIRRGAQVAGAQGGSRQGIAEGLASEGVSRAFSQGSGALRFQDVAQRQQAATALSGFGLGQQQLQSAGAQAGLGSLGSLFNLGMSPFSAQFAPLQSLAGILGGPTVLQAGGSQQQATGSSSGSGFNFGVGGTIPFLGG